MSSHDKSSSGEGLAPAVRGQSLMPVQQFPQQLLASLMEPQPETTPSIDFGSFGRALRRFWPVLVLSLGLCTGAAWYYLKRTPTLYLALGEIGVGQERSELLPSAAARGEDLKSLEMLKSIERQIAGQNVLIEVARRFDLHHDATLAGPRAAEGLRDDEVVVALSRRVTANLERGTRNIVVSVEDTDPQRARDICQAIIDLVVKRDPGSNSEQKEKALAALETRVSEARGRMDAAQAQVNAFRAKYPDLPLDESPSDLKTNSFEDRLKVLNADAVKAQEEVSGLEATIDRINAAGTNLQSLLAVPGLAAQEAAIAQRKALAEAQAKLAESDYGPKHPAYRSLQQQIAEISGGLLQVLVTGAKVEHAKYERAKANLDRIESQIASMKSGQGRLAVVAGDFQKLARQLKSARDSYSTVLARLNEEKTNSGFGASALSVVADPLTPSSPWKPRRLLTLAAGGVAGGMLGLGIIAVLLLLDRSIRTLGSGERILRLPGLAAVPRAKLEGDSWMSACQERDGILAEAFRGLRASLTVAGRNGSARSFLFTSARAGEGKSFVALNFAASLARQGYRTLLIDANLREPVLDRMLLGRTAEAGLAEYLSGESEADAKLCTQTPAANLFLFAAGTPRAHPGEILNEPAFARLLQESLKWFHRVIIDTPACGQFADAVPLARHADAVCLIVRPGTTRKAEALKTIQRLTSAGARPSGFVLNAAPDSAVREASPGMDAPPRRSPALLPALPPAGA